MWARGWMVLVSVRRLVEEGFDAGLVEDVRVLLGRGSIGMKVVTRRDVFVERDECSRRRRSDPMRLMEVVQDFARVHGVAEDGFDRAMYRHGRVGLRGEHRVQWIAI